ncbi:Right origin-binding protein [Dickeya dianthicola]|uniref:Helix-turn-helix domain-containing protein n=4 Tax=Dickeya dianthicola TaxID=204039 RepID=A0ABX9NIU9_9GAMM|nr:Right origin-binding protein [Dickeya dianthicola]MBI0439066.1 helix-turn-helix domain-containing protein [Dickeya dianthicola]MBI0450316.1 helix-turn-helix domain-containing protein [Dickeya dianthicola]MBI0454966.1 helix-turn-helix domain-containing protein [Dickeya dianthicola]MBI0459075.1 helix-turn-helix domain-containing protein [Dickeya dianthicola]
MMLSTMPSMMRFTADLIGWIENHLESPLMINDVTAKSGYSKWHLQRIFKKETGVSLGSYIRSRRLSKAAIELKLTNQTIQDVALRYCFDSQQSFTRTFKKHFGMSPGHYRKALRWDFSGLQPSLGDSVDWLPIPEVVDLPARPVNTSFFEHTQNIDDFISASDIPQRIKLWEQTSRQYSGPDVVIYSFSTFIPDPNRINRHVRVAYHISAVDPYDNVDADNVSGQTSAETERYLRFMFAGDVAEYTSFLKTIYHHILPGQAYTRMSGGDLEVIRCKKGAQGRIDTDYFEAEYYIPFDRQ